MVFKMIIFVHAGGGGGEGGMKEKPTTEHNKQCHYKHDLVINTTTRQIKNTLLVFTDAVH